MLFFSSRRRHTRWPRDWSSDVCSSDLLLTGGNEPPVTSALKRMLAMRAWFRARQLGEEQNPAMLEEVGLDADTAEEMHRYLAIADYEDRYVIPTSHREQTDNAYQLRGGRGFTFGNGCDGIDATPGLFAGT